jgi:hypothetical protein
VVLRHPQRLPLLAMGIAALLTGLWAGLLRLGWDLPLVRPTFPATHGPLMIAGFLGTLISLERAVALGRRWAYAAPLLSGVGGLSLIAGLQGVVAQAMITAGSLGLVAIFLVIIRLRPALYAITMGLGALSWMTGNFLWLAGWPMYHIVSWWAGFLVLTIAGERQELARLQRLSTLSHVSFLGALGILLAGLVLSTGPTFEPGARLVGAGMAALALWLAGHDIARRTVRQTGLSRFIAICLLSGYVWLGISGMLGLLFGGVPAGPQYDAILHAFFLGFVFAMIFGHAPIIFPAILGAPMAYRRAFYAHLILLQVTLILRISSDLMAWGKGRQVGGLLNVITLLLFLANTIYSLWLPTGRVAPTKAGVVGTSE